ncbi:hypothetical protein [Pseudonocardia sp. TRM90224]|uniref:hypothetical protein n=1 Tax=Pseudonocardia sp. TRM90224 TaxID=2812678 RepID=UPI001E3322D4|nr:hypothetical protein [Pseudonocardia sp. TRM90224]
MTTPTTETAPTPPSLPQEACLLAPIGSLTTSAPGHTPSQARTDGPRRPGIAVTSAACWSRNRCTDIDTDSGTKADPDNGHDVGSSGAGPGVTGAAW